ncbi:uncharacterized protein TNCV_3795111 [Trichonephila clavipes]|nr:uncharacterized protein TNCV_3795111 [Trichonephila clavipes]
MDPWNLHARMELYKGMVAQSLPGVFFIGPVWDLWCVHHPPSMQFVTLSCCMITVIHLCCYVFRKDMFEQGVKGQHAAPTSLIELWTALANTCQDIPVEYFQKLAEYMSCRVAAVIKARRGLTRC